MTTALMTENPAVYTPPAQYKLSAAGLLRGEWTKFWSLRSSWIVLVCAAVFGAGIAVAVAATYDGGIPPEAGLHPIDFTMVGVGLSAVFIAILGVLFITGEYSTGSIRSTMAAAPKRTGVLWAKAAVFGAIVFAMYATVVGATFLVTQVLLDGTDMGGVSLSDPDVLRVLAGGYVAATVYLGLLGLAVGAILRNSAGAIGFYIGVIIILPNLAGLLPWEWVGDITPYAPGNVANVLSTFDTAGTALSVGQAWLWMGIWTVFSFGLAAVLLKRRDV
ncbi:ABC transporter permease [Glycomyces sp. L485]|uniref:ABC transporter permease subunit n=1 Tax=Glycomyces sp. L485 TaxID=2909235 RepID=UPI001F4AD24B|nr:ABC transporter permease subunit [Glycomyces sp. L485]MCH7230366.1 ABC transporter permease [Glycomyces sp. L485]